MACNCHKSAHLESVRLARSQAAGRYGYQLLSYDGCTTMHRGAYQGLTLYVVGRNTPEEAVFNGRELVEASSYSKQVKRTIEALATGDVCDQAVVDAFEIPLAERLAMFAAFSESRNAINA